MAFWKKFCLAFYFLLPSALSSDTLSLSGNPSTLTVSTAVAGAQPTSATNTSTTYSLSTLTVVRSINGKINTAMPAGATLQLKLTAPTGATSLGNVTMTTTAANLVTSIPALTTQSNLSVTYTFSATAAAAHVTGGSKTLTLTIQ